jgi:hypothetical protein
MIIKTRQPGEFFCSKSICKKMKYTFFEDNEHLINELIRCFTLAESRLKEIERGNICNGVVIPAINELRYSASHIISSIKNDSSSIKNQEESLRRAIRHSQRASYDAIEGGILFALDEIKVMQESYHDMVISSIVHGWADILANAKMAHDKIKEIAITIEKEDNYELAYEYYKQLVQIIEKFPGYREELNKARFIKEDEERKDMQAKEEREIKEKRFRFKTLCFSGTAIIIAVLGILVRIYLKV